MYADPTHIRSHPVKVRFNDAEHALINALAHYNGMQPAALVRALALSVATAAIKNDK
ncbi:MAG TPA: plasmid mobilization protein, partial [Xylella fastidiosa subsp. pauca]